eukprot:gnl/TRDRNA2_/TRDRNA2_145821_c0_seq1.p1 gnl/TRDRNA2_/TRDRNA2_145821_c0~~gnl/TRDRNA2_/TRDRNA2_145821_c0_seq1.p1  ORF type:complete len:377 (+),score=36.51 gnl/TRDRNA2_/TRDRNA2_145821_c0_seq1:50-1180(+)
MDYCKRPDRYKQNYSENEEILSWLRKETPEPVLEPDLPIVDPHHHLWDRRRDACKYRTIVYGLTDFLEDVYDGHNVVGTVYCQSKCWRRCHGPAEFRPVGEVEFCQGVSATCEAGLYGPKALEDTCVKVCWGIQGEVDLHHPNVEAVLSEMMRCRNFTGVRASGPYNDDFKRGLHVLQKYGLVLDVWNAPNPGYVTGELPKLAAVAQEFPDVCFVLNHLGGLMGPAMGGAAVESVWRAELAELAAKCPNIMCKVGGIFMRVNGFKLNDLSEPVSSTALADLAYPWFSHAISCFGASRCMFESNFPADRDSVSYRTLWNAFKRVALKIGLSDAEKKDIFHDTAVRVYKLRAGGTKRSFAVSMESESSEPPLRRLRAE